MLRAGARPDRSELRAERVSSSASVDRSVQTIHLMRRRGLLSNRLERI
jgi:hypothetical protein